MLRTDNPSRRAPARRPGRWLAGLVAAGGLVLGVACAEPVETQAGRVETTTTTRAKRTTTTERATTTTRPTTTTTVAPTTVPPTTAPPVTPPPTTAPPTTAAPQPVVTAPPPPPPPPPTTAAPAPTGCHPSYTPCVQFASDVDCAGGSGNGPAYTGFVTVIGPDEYGLDADGDGQGCE